MRSPFAAFGRVAPGRPGMGRAMPSMAPAAQPGLNMQQLRNMYQSIAHSANPMQMIQQMIAKNPKFAQINNLFRQGQTPEGIFRSMAKQRGIDPDEFIRQLQDNNGR